MSEFFKRKRIAVLAISALFLAVTMLAGSAAYLLEGAITMVAAEKEGAAVSEEDDILQILPEEIPQEPEPPPPEPEPEPISFRRPGEMRGVFLVPGADFITTPDTSPETIKSEIDKALAAAKALTMNTVIIDTVFEDKVIYNTINSPVLSGNFDIMDYILTRSREEGLFAYAIFDASFYGSTTAARLLSIGGRGTDTLAANLREFTERYPVDGILLDGYLNTKTPGSYGIYSAVGAAIGFDNFMRTGPEATMRTFSNTLRKYARNVQVGILADAVWQNADDHEEGSATAAAFTSLGSGFADTRGFLSDGLVDFVAVKAFSSTTDTAVPFGEVIRWWANESRDAGVPMYAVHASGKIVTQEPGWSSQDQLVRQIIEANEVPGFSGSIFNSLRRLQEDPQSAATALVRYYNDEVEAEHILTVLEVTYPAQTSFTTTEPIEVIRGASDPNFPVTVNGQAISTDANGFFSYTVELKAGENTVTVSHKDRTVTFNITRRVEILREISPQGTINTEGGMDISISAFAYGQSEVYAVINGTTVQMSVDEYAADEEARDSSYMRYIGTYRTPAATGEVQNLGAITVYASWQGQQQSLAGASVRVNKKVQIEDGVPVVVIADQAFTYPANTLNNIPNPNYFPLPKGAMDYAVGGEITYASGGETHRYYVLASGVRVNAQDIAGHNDYASGNVINGVTVHSADGFTYVTVKTAQKVSYNFAHSGDNINITFHNTTQAPDRSSVGGNAMFSGASWNGSVLTLNLVHSAAFMGYKGYYDGDDLVLRFNTPPNSISGARIAIDPGHGGRDPGAPGFLADYPEARLNRDIARRLAEDLKSRGASVLLLDTSGGMGLQDRVHRAEQWNADIFVSVHNNTAPNTSAAGTEVYYFYPFARGLASAAATNTSSALSTNNRGAKQSYYHITLSSQMSSILVECGFMSNKAEYEKLINSKAQARIASGIADAVASAIRSASTGYSGGGRTSQDPDSEADLDEPLIEDEDNGTNGNSGTSAASLANVSDIYFDRDEVSMLTGTKQTMVVLSEKGAAVDNKLLRWESDDTAVAAVSGDGTVTARNRSGGTWIHAYTDDGRLYASCMVTVISAAELNAVTDIYLDLDWRLELFIGETFELAPYLMPLSARNVPMTWSSGKPDAAAVSQSGVITAKKAGEALIRVELKDKPGVWYEIEVAVFA
ncbi:MAG: N-acetylmuramoyl-L-alanine amidase [Oscillospiraceae bacterium]|nr:N-acetylmuramoyl-L-alanine amidase [Oscillospiraceae bacterium]